MKIIFTIMLFLISLFTFSQKVDLDPFRFKFKFRDLPHTVCDSTLNSYSIKTTASGSLTNSVSKEEMESKLNVTGLKKVEVDNEEDLKIHMTFGEFFISKAAVVDASTSSTNKDGTVNRYPKFYYSVEYQLVANAEFRDPEGVRLMAPVNYGGKNTWTSSEYNSYSAADNYYNNNRQSIFNSLVRERITSIINQMNVNVDWHLGFASTSYSNQLWLVANKKHPEQAAMQKLWDEFLPLINNKIDANGFDAETRNKFYEFIKYFDGLKTVYTKDEKGDRKVRYSAFYNNALLYILLDEPEKAIAEAEGLIANNYDESDGERFKKNAQDLIELMRKNNLYKRHFETEKRPYGLHW